MKRPELAENGSVKGMLGHGITRRTLIERSILLGLSVPAVPTLLVACGDDDADDSIGAIDDPGDDDETDPIEDDDDETDPIEDADDETEPIQDDEPDADDDVEATEGADDDDDQYGGTLNVAILGEPVTLNVPGTTQALPALIGYHIYESLFTWDEDYQLHPELAESFDVSEDGLLQTVSLREGVLFHNGEEMTASDVIASVNWYGELAFAGGGAIMAATDEIVELDDYTVEFRLTDSIGTLGTHLARQNGGCTIYPASVIPESTSEELHDFIGTGPWQFADWQPDQFVLFERFDEYVARDEEPTGYGGRKTAFVDQIAFIPVPDEASRIAGLQAGDYHYVENLTAEQYEVLEDDPSVMSETVAPISWDTFNLNQREPSVMTDIRYRQAVAFALDHDAIMTAGSGAGFYRLDPGLMLQESVWHSDIGADMYNPNDPDRARELLEEIGYDGTPLKIITTQEFMNFYNNCVVAQQQLEDVGFNVDMQVFDWATLLTVRNEEPENWDICASFINFRPDPVMVPYFRTEWGGHWDTEGKLEAQNRLNVEPEFEERYAALEDFQELFYEEVGGIKLGDPLGLIAHSPMLRGFEGLIQLEPFFWNVWLEE